MGIAEYTLNLEPRDRASKADVLRRQGKLPLALYGKGIEPMLFAGDTLNISKTLKRAGESSLVNIKVAGQDDRIVIFKEPQYSPVTNELIHVDLYQVNLKEKIRAQVQLTIIGEAPAVKDFDGILITNKDEIEVECLPSDLPHEITVDVSGLANIDDEIKVKDLQIPAGVEVLEEAEDSVAVVTAKREEEVEEVPVTEADAIAQVEVTTEKTEEGSEPAE
jgi:large subunit ribosomal protein L25